MADSVDPFLDSDGDLLPDRLEWLLLSDPHRADTDADQIDDFLEAVQHHPPNAHTPPQPLDHEMRALVHGTSIGGTRYLVLDVMMRVAGDGLDQVTMLEPFVMRDTAVRVFGVIGHGLRKLRTRHDPTRGSYVIASMVLGPEASMRRLLPLTVGVRGRIGSRDFMTGTYLIPSGGEVCAIVPISATDFTIQPLDAQGGRARSFWRANFLCKLQMMSMGTGWRSHVLEVTRADCSGAPALACPPDCSTQIGRILVLPFGLGFLRGG